MDSLKFLQDNSSILLNNLAYNNPLLFAYRFFIAYWRVESDMFCVDESNKIRLIL